MSLALPGSREDLLASLALELQHFFSVVLENMFPAPVLANYSEQ